MPDNRQVQSNAVSNQSTENVEEAFWRLKIHDNQDGGVVAQSSPYPDRPGEPDCVYYMRTGLCGYGSNCRFNHPAYVAPGAQYHRDELPERVGQPDCGYFMKTGTCKYGSTCKYHHPKDRNGAGPVSFNALGFPMRQDEKSCPYYVRTGSCKFGVACKFHHPQPATLGTGIPVNGPATYGSVGSQILPSSGLPYVGGFPTWSLPRPPYLSGPRLQSPQGYMPVVVSPSQGWNTYMGNLSPVSSANVIGSNLLYNSKYQGDSGSNPQMNMMPMSSLNLPERPDQPECRYFMNNGTCKYGFDCKYHHPKDRIAQSALSTISPLGLPSRPGQPVCSNYSLYGLCKFGPTCKYDHPFVGYPYNYGLTMPPPLSMLDSSLLTYSRMSPTARSSETSSMSSKLPDWSKNTTDGASKKQETKKSVDASEHTADSSPPPPPPPLSLQTSTEPPSHDHQSD